MEDVKQMIKKFPENKNSPANKNGEIQSNSTKLKGKFKIEIFNVVNVSPAPQFSFPPC